MAIRVALNHRTRYVYDRLVELSPQIVRLRPAPHTRSPVHRYSLTVRPADHFINWQGIHIRSQCHHFLFVRDL